MSNGAERLRRELMIRFVREFRGGTLEENIDRIPVDIRPRDGGFSRCCIYHDRAVLKYRVMALLGVDFRRETDETKTLRDYCREARERGMRPDTVLTVCAAGCDGCPPSRIDITDNCRGCFARPCVYSCPKHAISIVNHRAVVDDSKCIKCGKCLKVCPFNAIIRTAVPCEDACPVGAIRKNADGVAEIDFDRCISCGKCFSHCPFGAVMERSELFDVLRALEGERPVVAMVAPSAQFQFPGGIGKLFTAISKAGFADVMEVALGAELTSEHEAREFVERLGKGEKLMTTSCCTAYVELVGRHVPALSKNVSTTPSPMRFAAQLVKEKRPDAVTVFIGPCIAKRYESLHTENVDLVLTFEELGALLAGSGLDIMGQNEWVFPHPADAAARNFAKSCGVTEAVLEGLLREGGIQEKLDSKFINGIDRKSVKLLELYAAGKLPGNFLEVMCCEGGCVSGPCSLVTK